MDINDEERAKKRETESSTNLAFGVETPCPIYLAVLYGIQQVLENAGGVIGAVYLVWSNICPQNNYLLFAELVNTMLFIIGLSTFIQVTVGFRLPILEGSAYSYIPPIVAMMQTNRWKCLPPCNYENLQNATITGLECEDDAWKPHLLEVSGGLMAASAVQMILGLTGAVGFILHFISPLTTAVVIVLVGLSLFDWASYAAGTHWGIAFLTFGLYILFSMILTNVKIPLPTWSVKRRWHLQWVPIFRMFPSLLALGLVWLLCYLLTEHTSAFSSNPDDPTYQARTDTQQNTIKNSKWIFFPYPGRYGSPTVGIGIFTGFLASVLSSTIESIGDYHAIARAAEIPPPPKHAVNRGIAVEGFCSLWAGAVCSCLGVTSYSYISGMVGVTGMASRRGWQVVAVVFMLFGLVGKLGAALAMIPQPVIGGFNIMGIGILISMGISNLTYVDLKSIRNLVVLGPSILLGLIVPRYLVDNPNSIHTGSDVFDQMLIILLSTGMCVGGISACLLDNIIPGTEEERGMIAYRKHLVHVDPEHKSRPADPDAMNSYDLPLVASWLRRHYCCTFVPFMSSYIDRRIFLDKISGWWANSREKSKNCGRSSGNITMVDSVGQANHSYSTELSDSVRPVTQIT